MKAIRLILLFVTIGACITQSLTEEQASPNPYNKTDEETATILKDFQSKPELLLCIGVFTKIPKEYLNKKVTPLKEIVSNPKAFAKYVDRYFFNSILSCVKSARNTDPEKVNAALLTFLAIRACLSFVRKEYLVGEHGKVFHVR